MTALKSVMIAGGGTGGHIYPALAIGEEVKRRYPDCAIVFVGTRYGMEKDIVPRAGFPLEFVEVRGLKGKSLWETVKNLARLPLASITAWSLVSKHDPDALLGVGGYASGPVLLVGALRGRPTLVQEQNAYPGLTNRMLSKFASQLAVAFPKALEIFGKPGEVTGNPVRSEFFEKRESADKSERVRLLIFGGSQGSRILNDTMSETLGEIQALGEKLEIVHQTGPNDLEKVRQSYARSAFASAEVTPFIDDMAGEMGRADLVLCRAGAMTISELAAIGRPAILVPFALASDNHQEFNARSVEEVGGGVMITESELSAEKLASTINRLVADRSELERMGASITMLAAPDAASRVVDLVEKILKKD